jgi:hypothetical protein
LRKVLKFLRETEGKGKPDEATLPCLSTHKDMMPTVSVEDLLKQSAAWKENCAEIDPKPYLQ